MIFVELRKLARRPRTWVSIALLCLLPALVAVFLAVNRIAPRPGSEPAFLFAVLANGALFPAAALAIVLPIFLPVAVAVVGGDAIAGEASGGTLRYLLLRPVSRTRLLVAKLISLTVYTGLAVLMVAVTSYVVGVSLFASQPAAVVTVSGTTLTTTELVLRIAAAMGYVGVSMLGVGAIALFLSTLTESALGATLGALAALIASQVLVTLDAAGSVRPYLPTRYWLAWIDLFRDPIPWRDIERGLALQAVYVAVFLAMAWANFTTKDVKS
ncbi:ABC transporter permease [Rhizocola hellebori]|uniref:ABC transporter permease n=1 Tax=Rhizocola hellebori TaxID=1392758 RepID=A0A8J3VH58_9ACTN|nr:ABC transporter permease [Rhizocola hellebori]GIH06160.1 ABC transporter permease [Rhizocola hellebori]